MDPYLPENTNASDEESVVRHAGCIITAQKIGQSGKTPEDANDLAFLLMLKMQRRPIRR